MFKKWFKKKDKAEQEFEGAVEQVVVEDAADDVVAREEDASVDDAEAAAEEVAVDEAAVVDEVEESAAQQLVDDVADDAVEDVVEVCVEELQDEAEAPTGGEDEVAEGEKVGFFKKLFKGLDKTRKNITENIDRMVNNYDEIDDELFEELEEILITADIGMNTALALVEELKALLVERRISDPALVKEALVDVLVAHLSTEAETALATESPTVILVIGVNGAGKTTSIGKIGNLLKNEGKTVILAAADTFRAAAIDQLKVWAERAELPVIAHSEGADPAAVVFDACQSAKAKNADVLIIDTAGRLHNKVNLMNELNKIFRIVEREFGDAKKEVLLVLDATTGQNALQQAKLFKETAPISGLVVTKLDGTAKGGFVFAIKSELDIPVKLIGVGEKIDDLQHFDAADFASALMQSQ